MSADKHKDKIKKLLELSLSDNEHEASIASRQAVALMNKHNISKESVYQQQMICKKIISPYFRLPDWYKMLYGYMTSLSGCFMVYSTGCAEDDVYATVQIAGRERDVENTDYLTTFLSRALEKSVKSYRQQLKQQRAPAIARHVNSYRKGFLMTMCQRMIESKRQFFTAEKKRAIEGSTDKQLVCVDDISRAEDAQDYYHQQFGCTVPVARRSTTVLKSAADAGTQSANQLEVNSAISGQNDIKRLSN